MKLILNILLWCISKLSQGCTKCRPALFITLGAVTFALTGCDTYYRSVDGVNLEIIQPIEDVQVSAFHYLSGDKITVKSPSKIEHTYTTISSNDYFGCIHIREQRTNNIALMPVMTNLASSVEY